MFYFTVQETSSCSCCPVHRISSVIQLLQQVIRKVVLLEINLNEVKVLLETRNTDVDDSVLEFFPLPVTNLEGFDNFETFLQTGNNMSKAVSIHTFYILSLRFANVGGSRNIYLLFYDDSNSLIKKNWRFL